MYNFIVLEPSRDRNVIEMNGPMAEETADSNKEGLTPEKKVSVTETVDSDGETVRGVIVIKNESVGESEMQESSVGEIKDLTNEIVDKSLDISDAIPSLLPNPEETMPNGDISSKENVDKIPSAMHDIPSVDKNLSENTVASVENLSKPSEEGNVIPSTSVPLEDLSNKSVDQTGVDQNGIDQNSVDQNGVDQNEVVKKSIPPAPVIFSSIFQYLMDQKMTRVKKIILTHT